MEKDCGDERCVDLQLTWNVARKDVAQLKRKLLKIKEELQ